MPAGPQRASPDGAAAPVVGVDVGGTKVAVALIENGEIVDALERPTDVVSSEALLAGIEMVVEELVARTGASPARAGVGVPSQIDFATGCVVSSVNIPLAGVELRVELGRRLAMPVVVDNDANCAALAEAQVTPGGPTSHLVMYTLGTGVGGGVVIDGRIFRGASGLGAELGHVVVDENGPQCPGNCPGWGCIEAFCSGTALERDATEVGEARPDSRLGRLVAESGVARGREVVEAAQDGDSAARDLLKRLGRHLGVGLAGAVNTFEPQHVVVGGGLSRAGDLFLESARTEAAARALPALFERVSISIARRGSEAGVVGAGLLALHELESAGDTAASEATEGET